MDTKSQVQNLFQKQGMNPEKVQYNENLDIYKVNIGVEGTDKKFLRGVGELGNSGPVSNAVDTSILRVEASRIDGSEIADGTVNIVDTMRDEHFRIEVN